MDRRRIAHGFTLIELVISLTLFSILAALSIPMYWHWRAQHAFQAHARAFHNMLVLARFSAIKENTMVEVCPSIDLRHCAQTWSHAVLARTQEGKVLQIFPLDPNVKLAWRSSLGQNQRLAFTPLGSTVGQQGSFVLSSGAQSVQFTINHGGRIRQT